MLRLVTGGSSVNAFHLHILKGMHLQLKKKHYML